VVERRGEVDRYVNADDFSQISSSYSSRKICRHFGQNIDSRAYKETKKSRFKNVQAASPYTWRVIDGVMNPDRDLKLS